jgi:hypothetical protein
VTLKPGNLAGGTEEGHAGTWEEAVLRLDRRRSDDHHRGDDRRQAVVYHGWQVQRVPEQALTLEAPPMGTVPGRDWDKREGGSGRRARRDRSGCRMEGLNSVPTEAWRGQYDPREILPADHRPS